MNSWASLTMNKYILCQLCKKHVSFKIATYYLGISYQMCNFCRAILYVDMKNETGDFSIL